MPSRCTEIIPQASTLVKGDGRAERQLEGSTETQGAYKGRTRVHEADPGPSISALEADRDGPWGGGGLAPPGYLELYANVSTWLDSTCDKKGSGWFIAGECENGHRFVKELVCGKEWCSRCREDGSVAHNRRFARWLPKVQQLGSLGYFVFTLPESVRSKYRTKKALAGLGHRIQELLKGFGFSRGLRRFHWFGDRSTKYHPHLNCLVDGGYISQEILGKLKAAYAGLLGVDLADVNYHYRRSPGQMVHTLKYVARGTFHDYEWDMDMAMELRGFRNMVVWGRGQWDNEPAWSLADLKGKARAAVEGLDIQAIDALVKKVCPVCGIALTWGEALPIGLLNMVEKQPLGAGYYRLTDLPGPGPPRELSPVVQEAIRLGARLPDRATWHRRLLGIAQARGRVVSPAELAFLYGEECD